MEATKTWTTANIIPLYKTGNEQKLPNYLPVSLTNPYANNWKILNTIKIELPEKHNMVI